MRRFSASLASLEAGNPYTMGTTLREPHPGQRTSSGRRAPERRCLILSPPMLGISRSTGCQRLAALVYDHEVELAELDAAPVLAGPVDAVKDGVGGQEPGLELAKVSNAGSRAPARAKWEMSDGRRRAMPSDGALARVEPRLRCWKLNAPACTDGRSTFRNRQIVDTFWQYMRSVSGDLLSEDLRRASRR